MGEIKYISVKNYITKQILSMQANYPILHHLFHSKALTASTDAICQWSYDHYLHSNWL